MQSAEASASGWMAALCDPLIGRILAMLHEQPAEHWTVEELARRTAVSRSVLAERFSRLIGVPPMRYLVHWRLRVAADLPRTTTLSLSEVAERVGYASESAFSRAFKRGLGQSPAAWRQQREESGEV